MTTLMQEEKLGRFFIKLVSLKEKTWTSREFIPSLIVLDGGKVGER